MLVRWKCPCDLQFGTQHRRDFAVEGNLTRTEGGRQIEYDWRRFVSWLTREGPATEITIDRFPVYRNGQWLLEEARSSCIDRSDDFIDLLLARPLG